MWSSKERCVWNKVETMQNHHHPYTAFCVRSTAWELLYDEHYYVQNIVVYPTVIIYCCRHHLCTLTSILYLLKLSSQHTTTTTTIITATTLRDQLDYIMFATSSLSSSISMGQTDFMFHVCVSIVRTTLWVHIVLSLEHFKT